MDTQICPVIEPPEIDGNGEDGFGKCHNKLETCFAAEGRSVFAGIIIEENQEWITLALAKAPSTEPKDMLITKKGSIRYKEITMKQMKDFNKQFGKGYLSVIN